jgi:hypothetical protein
VHTGQFFAKNIEVRSAADIQLKPFQGIWDDGDECQWDGAVEGQSCTYNIACPGTYSRKCVQGACRCVVDPAGRPTPDGCSGLVKGSNGQWDLVYAAAGTACTPTYACSSTATCDDVGYCHCATSTPVGECTMVDPTVPGTIRPVKDGTVCSSYSGTCAVTPTCAGGLCSCTAPQVPVGTNPDCLVNEPRSPCIGYDCFIGLCNASGVCECPSAPDMVQGHPIRLGTQNVAAIPVDVTEKYLGMDKQRAYGGCGETYRDLACQATLLADKISASPYDFIALNEAFDDDDYRATILNGLYASGTGPYPYVLKRLDDSGDFNIAANSGLMFLSRWPFDTFNPGESGAECYTQPGQLDVGGCPISYMTLPVPGTGGSQLQAIPFTNCAAGFEIYNDTVGTDGWAEKGIGYARLVAPTGRIVNVFFTHTQSTTCSDVSLSCSDPPYEQYVPSSSIRVRQMRQANSFIQCMMSHRAAQNEAVVLMGDLNIEGDLSNPYETMINPPQPALWNSPLEMRNEWEYMFNGQVDGQSRIISAAGLKDTWAYSMTPMCVPAIGSTYSDVQQCQVVGAKTSEWSTFQRGPVAFDRGVTWANDPNSEERLDYILVGHSSASTTYPSQPQHIARADNLLKERGDVSSFSRNPGNDLGGSSNLSDHFGLNAELDDPVSRDEGQPGMSPGDALDIPIDDGQDAFLLRPNPRLAYPTAVHWYRLNTPGDYAISVNPFYYWSPGNSQAGPDNGISYQIYEATDMSKPMAPYKGEVIEVPPTIYDCVQDIGEFCTGAYHIPGYRSGRVKSANFPLYIKVFASDPSKLPKSGGYNFFVKRMGCGSMKEACTMIPFEKMVDPDTNHEPSQVTLTAVKSNELWYAFTLEHGDAPWPQSLRFYAAERADAEPRFINSVAIFDEDGVTHKVYDESFAQTTKTVDGVSMNVWEYSETYSGGFPGPLTKAIESPGIASKKFYMRVLRNPGAVIGNILTGWTTNLTWEYGPGFGGKVPCEIHVNDTQEASCDEVYISLANSCGSWSCPDWPSMRSEASEAIQFNLNFNEEASQEWTRLFFEGLYNRGITHASGQNFRKLPAFGTTVSVGLHMWENDNPDEDEDQIAWTDISGGPKVPEYVSGNQTIIWPNDWDDGEYVVSGCNFSHHLKPQGCESNADCNSILKCAGGVCRQL